MLPPNFDEWLETALKVVKYKILANYDQLYNYEKEYESPIQLKTLGGLYTIKVNVIKEPMVQYNQSR